MYSPGRKPPVGRVPAGDQGTFEIPIQSERIGYQSICEIAAQQMEEHPERNAFCVTSGLTQWVAAAVKNHKKQGRFVMGM